MSYLRRKLGVPGRREEHGAAQSMENKGMHNNAAAYFDKDRRSKMWFTSESTCQIYKLQSEHLHPTSTGEKITTHKKVGQSPLCTTNLNNRFYERRGAICIQSDEERERLIKHLEEFMAWKVLESLCLL